MKDINLTGVQELETKEMTLINGGGLVPGILGLAGAAFYYGWSLGREYARQ